MSLHVLKPWLTTGFAAGLAGLTAAGPSHASPGPLLSCAIESSCSLEGSDWTCTQPDIKLFVFIEEAGRKITLIHGQNSEVYEKRDFGGDPIANTGISLSTINVSEDGTSLMISDSSATMGYVSMTRAQCKRAE